MAMLYALVARGSVVLAEFSATSTTANAIARQILEKIPGNNDTNASYSQDRYIFHVKRTDGLTVLCMADDTAGSKPISFSACNFLFRFSFWWLFDFVLSRAEFAGIETWIWCVESNSGCGWMSFFFLNKGWIL